jgi:hypothetical protein
MMPSDQLASSPHPRRFAAARVEHPYFHAEDFAIPLNGAHDVGDVDDEVVEGLDLDGHTLSFRRDAGCALLAAGELCYNALHAPFKNTPLGEDFI